MICSNCGTENKAGRKFCIQCGSGLAAACARCGSPLEAEARFCGECGTPVGRDEAAVSGASGAAVSGPSASVAERRVVSILFADLVGFTALAEGRDAEETRELLSRYFDLATEVVARYGGTVEKFIGDAVMAVWGAPTAHEDDAERAVRAALELVKAVQALGPTVEARAGVLTGEAAVTLGATNQGMVAGDLVNTASRLQSVAAPGTVLVGEATQRAASRAIAFEEAGAQNLKGKTAPVPAWRALRVVAEVGGRNRSETLEAPFVGRDDELRQLKDLFHATSRDRRTRLVSIIGPAGIGKSRLAWEFLKYIDGLVETVWWHDGRSPAYGEGISFWALGEMVRERCRLLETDDEATTRTKVAATLDEHVPDPDERRWIEPALLALLGIESATIGSDQLFGAWRTFFERLAATAPVIMVFEDFHFADAGLIDFVDHLLEWVRTVPIYVVTLSRPELLEKRADWGAGKRNFTSVYLEPLSEPAMRELLAGLVPGLPASAVTAIVSRADGIPLYAVETIRMLLAEGRLSLEGDRYVPTGDLTTLAVPETLTALVASRLDALDPVERALISDAAVLGQSFTPAALSAVSGTAEADLEPRLRLLAHRELLTLETDPRSPERGQYAFVQALIREVAYNTLARSDRKVRHLAAARFFESLGTDELAGALAGHYLAAQANSPEGAERDALVGQARLALRAAAGRATALGAHEQAVTFLEQALSITSDRGDRASLLDLAGEAGAAAGHFAAANASFQAALELRRGLGDRPAAAATVLQMARALLTARQAQRAITLLESTLSELADVGDDAAVVGLRAQLGRAYMLVGENQRSLDVVDDVLVEAERRSLSELLADTLVTRGTALTNLGRLVEGIGLIELGERLARSIDRPWIVLRAVNNRVAVMQDSWVNPHPYDQVSREALAIARRIGDRGWMFGFTFHVANSAWYLGEWDDALAICDDALLAAPEPGDHLPLQKVRLLVQAARGEDTTETLAELDRLATEVSDPQVLWGVADGHAFVDSAAGRFDEAARGWREAARLFSWRAPVFYYSAGEAAITDRDREAARSDLAALETAGVPLPGIELQRQALQAGLAAIDGRPDEAGSQFLLVLDALRDRRLPFAAATLTITMATLLGPYRAEVQAAYGEARDTLARLGAKPFLERLEAAMARPAPPAPEPTRTRDASTV
ncbi:MAG: AAA family ATPase [Candidatus Limnocylindrales bacterium]